MTTRVVKKYSEKKYKAKFIQDLRSILKAKNNIDLDVKSLKNIKDCKML